MREFGRLVLKKEYYNLDEKVTEEVNKNNEYKNTNIILNETVKMFIDSLSEEQFNQFEKVEELNNILTSIEKEYLVKETIIETIINNEFYKKIIHYIISIKE
ncbi:MAG: hypothetical protein ACRC7N_00715 [Clostridium sp.]